MRSLAIPLIRSVILGFLSLRVWAIDRRRGQLVTLLALCAVQGLVISLARHDRVPRFMIVQPLTATSIPSMTLASTLVPQHWT